MTRTSIPNLHEDRDYSLQLQKRKRKGWRERVAQVMPPILPTLIVLLSLNALFVSDHFLLEVFSLALCCVIATKWFSENRSKHRWIPQLLNKTTERISWSIYSIAAAFSIVTPAFANGGGGGAGCGATNTILGPIADALIKVFNNSTQIGQTGQIGDNICQVFTTFAAVIALLVIGSVLWGLFDNQVRGSDLGKAFAPLGLVLAGVVVTRISIKLVMGV